MTLNPSNSRRGTSLLLYIFLIPIAVSVYCLTLTQLQIQYADAQRNEQRVQARLLAESAIALLQTTDLARADLKKGKSTEGEIDGIGRYRVAAGPVADTFIASGEVAVAGPRLTTNLRRSHQITGKWLPTPDGKGTPAIHLLMEQRKFLASPKS